MIISTLSDPQSTADLVSLASKPLAQLVHAAREAHLAGVAASALVQSKSPTIQGLAGQMAGAAKAAEFTARSVACRMSLPVDVSAPHLPLMAGVGGVDVFAMRRLALLREFI